VRFDHSLESILPATSGVDSITIGGSTNSGALNLPSGITGNRTSAPVAGSFRWNTSLTVLEVYDGTATWVPLVGLVSQSAKLILTAPSGSSGVPTWRQQALTEHSDVSITSPSTDEVLKWNGSAWANSAPGAGAVTTVSSSRSLTAADNGAMLVCSTAVTLTIPASLPTGFACAIQPPLSGAVTFAISGTTLNGDTTSLTRSGGVDIAVALMQNGTNSYILSQVPQNIATHPGYVTGRYYPPFGSKLQPTPVAVSANFIVGAIFLCGERTTFTKIGITVATAVAASNIRLAIYNMSGGIPTSLLVDSGSISSATTGDKEVTISVTLEPGVYYLGLNGDNAGVYVNWCEGAFQRMQFGQSAPGTYDTLLYGSSTFGAMPGTFPTTAYVDTSISWNALHPYIWLRK
jgi:hypothetical protein